MSKFVKIVKNCQNCQNCQQIVNKKNVKNVKNLQIKHRKSTSKIIQRRSAQEIPTKDFVSAQITAKGGDLMFKYVETDELPDNRADPIPETVIQVDPESREPFFSEPVEIGNLISDEINLTHLHI